MSKEIDHENTPVPVCPHCGHKDLTWHLSAWIKYDGDTEDAECQNCNRGYRRKITIRFKTIK